MAVVILGKVQLSVCLCASVQNTKRNMMSHTTYTCTGLGCPETLDKFQSVLIESCEVSDISWTFLPSDTPFKIYGIISDVIEDVSVPTRVLLA